jgi:hypothetical protein
VEEHRNEMLFFRTEIEIITCKVGGLQRERIVRNVPSENNKEWEKECMYIFYKKLTRIGDKDWYNFFFLFSFFFFSDNYVERRKKIKNIVKNT